MSDHQLARDLRKRETWAEKIVWRWLRDRRFSRYKFRRQHPIGPYCLDFYCEEASLNIELDGGQHAGSPRDAARDRMLRQAGFRVLRFWNHDLLGNIEGVMSEIRAALDGRREQPS